MSDLLKTACETIATDKQWSGDSDGIGRRSRRTRLAVFLAGAAAVVAAVTAVAANDSSAPLGRSDRPLIPFVTTDAPSVGAGFSSPDG